MKPQDSHITLGVLIKNLHGLLGHVEDLKSNSVSEFETLLLVNFQTRLTNIMAPAKEKLEQTGN